MIRQRLHLVGTYGLNPICLLRNLRWWLGAAESEARHVFVLGAPRSGTTLLENIVAVHPDNVSLQRETGFFTKADMFRDGLCFPPLLDEYSVDYLRSESSDIVSFFDKVAEAACSEAGSSRFVEKTPQHVLRLPWLVDHFPQSQFVHLYRDGRDCYASARSTNVPQRTNVIRFAWYWKRCVERRLSIGGDERITDVRYEELVEKPRQVTRKLMGFLGQSFVPEQLDTEIRSKDPRSGRDVHSGLSEPVHSRSVERWRNELNRMEQFVFERIAGRQLATLGYPLSA
jgi:hypothetical protein